MRVNRMVIADLDSSERFPLETVDSCLAQFIEKGAVALGLNVATFDMNFIAAFLPLTAAQFTWRSIDLNAVYFAKAVEIGRNFWDVKNLSDKSAERQVAEFVPSLEKHHALFDAYLNCFALAGITGVDPAWFKDGVES